MHIKSNNQFRFLLDWYELSLKEQAEFDWEGVENDMYFRYRGQVYSLASFMRIDSNSPLHCLNWHGSHGDSYFSGILIRLSDCNDAVVVGRYF